MGTLIGEYPGGTLREAAEAAVAVGASLDGAHLAGANLAGANLVDANLVDANLAGARLRSAIPVVPNLHTRMLAEIEAGGVLEMGSWHLRDAACGTQHCRAGWAIHLAGEEGRRLEREVGSSAAGALITTASCPYLDRVPSFYCTNEDALGDIQRCAEIEGLDVVDFLVIELGVDRTDRMVAGGAA